MDDELDPREIARDKRRDHDAEATRRALMRSGMGKVFKQILDRQARDADEPPPQARRGGSAGLTRRRQRGPMPVNVPSAARGPSAAPRRPTAGSIGP